MKLSKETKASRHNDIMTAVTSIPFQKQTHFSISATLRLTMFKTVSRTNDGSDAKETAIESQSGPASPNL